jgi:hypothetical protein
MGTLVAGDTEQSFLEDWIFFVPEGKGCADVLMSVAVSAETIFALQNQCCGGWDVPSDKPWSAHGREGTQTKHRHSHYHQYDYRVGYE